MHRKLKFLDSLLKNPLYSTWIVPGKVDPLAHCKWCCKDVNELNMSESAFRSIMNSQPLYKSLPTHHW